ncbi:hypothetical protein HOY82DRAFT_495459 [Tuber indicum]|nr:hypothetical protein HOY82DRAFT_495459 [Tuber indicum]
MLVSTFLEGTVITNNSARNIVLIAITDTRKVYERGSFRCSDSIFRLNEKTRAQIIPVLLSTLENIVQVSVGADHFVGLMREGSGYAWGNGRQSQLQRCVLTRTQHNGFTPLELGFPLASRQVRYYYPLLRLCCC